MKQLFRFVLQPSTFFNQLQWSQHHWFILVAFLVVATIETLFGRNHFQYEAYLNYLQWSWSLSFSVSLWIIQFSRLCLMLFGAYAITWLTWIVGSLFGSNSSRRVLFRRMAIVLTVLLAANTMDNLTLYIPVFGFVSFLLYFWAISLGFFAVKEQFSLNFVEATAVALFVALCLTTSWHYSTHYLETAVAKKVIELTRAGRN